MEGLFVVLAILFLVALILGGFAIFWNKDKAEDADGQKK